MTVNELYALSAVNGIEVHSVKCPKAKAIALKLDGHKFIGIDRGVLKNEYNERLVLAHELAHSLTDSYYTNLNNPIHIKRMEHRATKKAVEMLVPENELSKVLYDGVTVFELAEHFSVPEDMIKKAMWFYYRKEIS